MSKKKSKFSFLDRLKENLQPIKEEMTSVFMFILTGKYNSERVFLDYFFGLPGAFRDDDGNEIHLNLAGKIFAWGAYFYGGFLLRPLQSIAKCIFEVPLLMMIHGFKKLIIPISILLLLPYLGLIRPILSPIDNIKYALSLKNKSYRRLLLVISATVTTLFYGSLIALTAGFALPLIAPSISVPVLSTMVSSLSVFSSASTVTIGAIATAITSIPLVASVINGIQTITKRTMKKEPVISSKTGRNSNITGSSQLSSTSQINKKIKFDANTCAVSHFTRKCRQDNSEGRKGPVIIGEGEEIEEQVIIVKPRGIERQVVIIEKLKSGRIETQYIYLNEGGVIRDSSDFRRFSGDRLKELEIERDSEIATKLCSHGQVSAALKRLYSNPEYCMEQDGSQFSKFINEMGISPDRDRKRIAPGCMPS